MEQTYMGYDVHAPTGTFKGKRTKADLVASAQRHHPLTEFKPRKIGNNTLEFEIPSSRGPIRVIQFHDTEIVRFFPDGSIELDSGGWQTVTTKGRMNDALPRGWGIYSDRGWYVRAPGEPERIPFFDGIKFDKAGKLTPASAKRVWSVANRAAADKKLIAKAIANLKAKGIVHDPRGDPWVIPDKRGLYPAATVRDWLRSDYVTQRLVLQAITWAGYRNPEFILRMMPLHINAVRRFLKACLGVGA